MNSRISSIIIIIICLISCKKDIQENALIQSANKAEIYRTYSTEEKYNRYDSLYLTNKMFRSFDEKNRLISENHRRFYFYDSLGRIDYTKSIYKRDRIFKIIERKYHYDTLGLLIFISANPHDLDTIREFEYNAANQLIKDQSKVETVFYTYRDSLLTNKRILRNHIERNSEYIYNMSGQMVIEKRLFSDTNRIQTRYEYYSNGLLKNRIDSSFNNGKSPYSVVESMEQYSYNDVDSLIRINYLHRIKSSEVFTNNGGDVFTHQ